LRAATLTAGIDTGKEKLDLAVHAHTFRLTVENAKKGWATIATELTKLGVTRVGIEASGGYERGVIRHLQAAGLTVIMHQPIQVRAFAKVQLRRAKNDTIDAALIAAFTALIATDKKMFTDPRLEPLTEQLTFVEQIKKDIACMKNRVEHYEDKRLRRILEAEIERKEKLCNAELNRIEKALREHDDLQTRLDLVLSVDGIGKPTAISLIVRMPELGHIKREQATSLAGLAAFDHDSGRHRGQRHIAGGRKQVRTALFAAALPASMRWNPALKDFYQRLIKRGHCHKSALIACARKLLIYANTVLHRGKPWTKTLEAAA
jgi:transposase